MGVLDLCIFNSPLIEWGGDGVWIKINLQVPQNAGNFLTS